MTPKSRALDRSSCGAADARVPRHAATPPRLSNRVLILNPLGKNKKGPARGLSYFGGEGVRLHSIQGNPISSLHPFYINE